MLYFIECLAAIVSDEKVQLEYALSTNNSKPYDNIEKSRLGVIQESCVEGLYRTKDQRYTGDNNKFSSQIQGKFGYKGMH